MAFVWAICFCICYVGCCASSIGSTLKSSLQCSKYHFEEKVLEKLVRLELKMEMYESKIKTWEDSISKNLDKIDDTKRQTETFLESMRDILHQEQTRLNDSFQETVKNIYLQSEIKVKGVLDSLSTKTGEYENRSENALDLLHSTLLQEQQRFNDSFQVTVDNIQTQSESKVKSILDSISFKMNEFSESHNKREKVLELLQSDFLQEQEQSNQSFHLMTNNIKEDLNKTIKSFISEIAVKECKDIVDAKSGIYTISPLNLHTFKLRCGDENWTVIQKRFNGATEFYRNWEDYENGFGDLNGEFWLGNRIIAFLTSIGTHELRINLEDWDGNKRYANFKNFKIDGVSDKYRLHISGYTGNAGDGMTEYNGYYFTTYDRDHDTHSGLNCAAYEGIKGAWWFHGCWNGSGASLNGKYTSGPSAKAGIIYRKWQSNSLKKSTMMIRKV